MKAFLLAAGRGLRFRPVTERIPKPLLPYLNVPIARAHLARLRSAGVTQAGVNLHHLGREIVEHLSERPAELPELRFFPEPDLLGTAGALRNASGFLSGRDFLVVNSDAAIEPDFAGLLAAHRASDRPATLLVVENREPQRYTPLQAEGDRILAFGVDAPDPLLYTGISVLDAGQLSRIPPGETQLVSDLWQPMLDAGLEIGCVRHRGPFSDLGSPGDFLNASLEALERRGPFPPGSGSFDAGRRVLAIEAPAGFEAERCVLGLSGAACGAGARLTDCAVFSGAVVGPRARLSRCLVAGGRVPEGAAFENVLLWPAADGIAAAHPLRPASHLRHDRSPLRQ